MINMNRHDSFPSLMALFTLLTLAGGISLNLQNISAEVTWGLQKSIAVSPNALQNRPHSPNEISSASIARVLWRKHRERPTYSRSERLERPKRVQDFKSRKAADPQRPGHTLTTTEPSVSIIRAAMYRAIEPSDPMLGDQSYLSSQIESLSESEIDTIVLQLGDKPTAPMQTVLDKIRAIRTAGFKLGYWIEVARSPSIANAHPEWMASLQTHDEWKRFYPDFQSPSPEEVTKTYPWVPIMSRETFEAQRDRVTNILKQLPTADTIFLNDLQGAPSACGCGNDLCRWTSDYGDRRTTIPIGDEAAAKFILEIQSDHPKSEVIPVWATECEEQDGHPEGQCAGVGCFKGICWKAYTRQLMPVSKNSDRIAALTLQRKFSRSLSENQPEENWLEYAIGTFQEMPKIHGGDEIPAKRIVSVIEAWEADSHFVAQQVETNRTLQTGGYIIAYDDIDQSWTPKIVRWK